MLCCPTPNSKVPNQPLLGSSSSSKSSSAIPPPSIINIPFPGAILGVVIRFLTHDELPSISTIKAKLPKDHNLAQGSLIKCIGAILELLDWLDCRPARQQAVMRRYETRFSIDPWGTFALAAKTRDESLARRAIKSIGNRSSTERDALQPTQMEAGQADAVPIAWFLAYLKACSVVDKELSKYPEEKRAALPSSILWDTISDSLVIPTG